MDLNVLANHSERYIDHYEQLEALFYGDYKNLEGSLWTEDMRFWFNLNLKKLIKTKLEIAISTKSDDVKYDGKAYERIKRELLLSNVRVKNKYQSLIPESQLLELAVLRLIAGAIITYADPLRNYSSAVNAGIAKVLTPTHKAQKAAKTLLGELTTQKLYLGQEFESSLEKIAFGENPNSEPQLVVDKKLRVKNLVREVSLLSKQLFTIENNKENRFPVKSIQRILDIVGDNASPRTIANHQSLFDGTEKPALSGDSYV